MPSRSIAGGALAAVAGAVMLAVTSIPSNAFTLYSPSLERPVASLGVEDVWWGRGGWAVVGPGAGIAPGAGDGAGPGPGNGAARSAIAGGGAAPGSAK
jgi:hypothetical protein